MLVKISYSINFEEVPKVVRGFLQGDIRKEIERDVNQGLEDSVAALEPGKENIGKAIKHIDEIRDFLVKLDIRLLDCSSILKGYQQELIGPSEHQHPPIPQPDLSSVQEDIFKLREKISGEEDEIKNR